MKKSTSLQTPLFDSIEDGLVIVGVLAADLLLHVRQAIEYMILCASDELDILLEGDSLLSLYSGSARQLEQAKALAAANGQPQPKMKHYFKAVGACAEFNWLRVEALHLLLSIIEDHDVDWITLELGIAGPITPAMADILFRIRDAATRIGTRVMIFLVCTEGYQTTNLHHFCDEYIEVAPCDPDPDDDIAFSFDCVNLRQLNVLGQGKKMCNVKVSNGKFHRRYAPFIAADLETRVMWVLRGRGKTLDEIGRLLKVDKSTVLRRLKGLPEPRPVDLGDDWLKRCLALLPNADADALNGDEQSEGRSRAKPLRD